MRHGIAWALALAICGCIGLDDAEEDRGGSSGRGEPEDHDDYDDYDDYDRDAGAWSPTPSPPRWPAECAPPADVAGEVVSVLAAADDSIHELIACGGAQMTVARSLPLVVIASNEDLVDADARRELGELLAYTGASLDVAFTHGEDGTWTMPVESTFDSTFRLRFFLPGAAEPLLDDVFSLESYLPGVRVDASLGWDELRADPTRRGRFRYTWEATGPLTHVLFPDGEPESREFAIELSLWDIGEAMLGIAPEGPSPLGPFARLGALEVDSRADIADARGAVRVDYDAVSERGTVNGLVSGGSVRFLFESLTAAGGAVSVAGTAEGLRFVDGQGLGGAVDYRVRAGGTEVGARSDFGSGRFYPHTTGHCLD